jgi:SAM-dependent methyltransferase
MAWRDVEVLVGLRDIAGLAAVGPSAVHNWRARHDDFPPPKVTASAGPAFDLHEVEAWLLDHGKIERPVTPRDVVWRVVETLRGEWRPEQVSSFVMSALLFIVVEARSSTLAERSLDQRSVWERTPDASLVRTLRSSAALIEAREPRLTGLLTPGLQESPTPHPNVIRAAFAALANAVVDAGPAFLHEVVERLFSFGRFDSAMFTPPSLARLMAGAVEPIGRVVVDPACGVGGLLMQAATRANGGSDPDRQFVGYDTNRSAVRYARSWLAILDEDADVQVVDSFRFVGAPGDRPPLGDTVLLDPPIGTKNWGSAQLYADEMWRFGAPPPQCGDLGWLQIALASLRPGGRAAVVLPTGATFRTGREAAIRSRMLEAGVIEAVIQLPPRMRPDSSIQLTVWLLRTPQHMDQRILFIDATSLGSAGRTNHDFDSAAVDRILSAVRQWRGEARVEDEIGVAVPMTEIIDGDLSPQRYVRRTHELDLDSLRTEHRTLRDRSSVTVIDMPIFEELHGYTGARFPLGDLVSLVRGSHNYRKDDAFGDVRLIQPASVSDPTHPLPLVGSTTTAPEARVRSGDLVVALSVPGAPVCQAPTSWEGAIVDRRCCIMRVKSDIVGTEWLAAWVRSSDYKHQVSSMTIGTSRARLPAERFMALAVPVPDRRVQHEVTDRLRMLDDAIARVQEVDSRLRRQRALEVDLAVQSMTDRGDG